MTHELRTWTQVHFYKYVCMHCMQTERQACAYLEQMAECRSVFFTEPTQKHNEMHEGITTAEQRALCTSQRGLLVGGGERGGERVGRDGHAQADGVDWISVRGHSGQALGVVAVRAQQRQYLVVGVGQHQVALHQTGGNFLSMRTSSPSRVLGYNILHGLRPCLPDLQGNKQRARVCGG